MLTPGVVRGPQLGDGHEYGLRLAFLDGRLESNWSYYVNKAARNNANPAIPALVRQTELGPIFGAEIDSAGGDTQSTKTSGLEVETVANLTKNWRLTCNFSTNDLETSERYPHLKRYQAQAKQRNVPTPETDAFLATSPDGTPLPGYTKRRFNLVTMYRFTNGPIKNFSVGGGAQFRDKSYKGNFDRNRDGVAEELWSSAYDVWNLMLGYRTKIRNRNVDFGLNVYNLFDKDYFRTFALSSGAWGDPRTFRFSARFDL
jgi:outer membrane receptor for ferric coprogen and ferric-rhodotorulic acid